MAQGQDGGSGREGTRGSSESKETGESKEPKEPKEPGNCVYTKLVLIGMPGCGKTTLAALTAERLAWPWFDSDQVIEKRQEMTVAEIFSRHGEGFFRELERVCVRELLRESGAAVISLGGGAVRHLAEPAEGEGALLPDSVLWRECFFVYVYRDIEAILRGVDLRDRPLLRDDPQRIRELFAVRHPLYERLGQVRVSNEGTVEEAVDRIVEIAVDKVGDGAVDRS